jgi:hypothetical protein
MELPVPHYYGNATRAIFIIAAIVLILGLPTVSQYFGIPIIFAGTAIAILAIAAGITNPIQRGSLILNMIVSVFGLLTFIYISWFMYKHEFGGIILELNQLMALLFLIASYLSVKSVRGYSLNQNNN